MNGLIPANLMAFPSFMFCLLLIRTCLHVNTLHRDGKHGTDTYVTSACQHCLWEQADISI